MTDQPAADPESRSRPERTSMTPLQKVAMGFVVVAIDTLGRLDVLPDFIGWAMVLWGLSSVRWSERGQLLGIGSVCAVVSLAVWFPQVNERVHDAELALKWALSLPDLLFILLFARAVCSAARAGKDRKFTGRFGVIGWVTCVVAALPPIADAADSRTMLGYADVAFVLLWLWLIWNTFAAHARPYAAARDTV
ncbi:MULTISPECIES: hypothetical protein [unclassified Nocardioides]|uniref:hypothetical protein n=1 Tax=unclassified Nocardioides TaxID=2615069 RepID=UPI0012E3AF26|nr:MULTISPECIES: hypothetical protein [unclassified Nocardioides]